MVLKLNRKRPAARGKRYSLFALIFLFSFPACAPEGPIQVTAGEKRCEHCNMGIVDLRFDAQMLTEKGKRLHFDSLECLASHLSPENAQPERVWVSAFDQSGSEIPLKEARILFAKQIRSPMGGHLSAYANEASFQSAMKELEGRQVDLDEFIRSNLEAWQDTKPVESQAE